MHGGAALGGSSAALGGGRAALGAAPSSPLGDAALWGSGEAVRFLSPFPLASLPSFASGSLPLPP
eukprot:4630957-Prymnesium_polylepis.1